ncbi:hypothetical protein GCM10007389_36520 [Pontibacter akesuensis]|nr:hypothetical protein GCM10007389_36520 [Pontibacter akesuensis]
MPATALPPKKRNVLPHVALGLSAVVYWFMAYATPRTDFTQLVVLYALVFAAYLYVSQQRLNVWHGIGAAIIFRLIFLFAMPALSDDYFRFVWDGHLLQAGLNPYLHLPRFFLSPDAPQVPGINEALFQQLNSQGYYSVYPPVAQAVFWLSVQLSPDNMLGSVVVIRLVLLLAEVGSILLLLRLLRKMALPEKHVLLYALNPLVILELVGNLHFEALLIFFLLLSLYQLTYQRLTVSAVAFGLAVGAKLLPLMFLPFVWRKLGWRKFILYGAVVAVVVVTLYLPLLQPEVLHNISQSVELYFRKFEFNASVYYVLRWLGFRVVGYNLIAILGPLLSMATFVAICVLAATKKLASVRRLAGFMATALAIFLFLSTTVHPWYLTTLLALTVMSHFRFAVAWTGLAILTYAAYRTNTYQESLTLVALEYGIVAIWLVIELYIYRQRQRAVNLKA